MTLLLGAAGAALAFLATRQSWAQVRTVPPEPLPASIVHVTGSALVPYADAIVVAGLACLVAVVATRLAWRRVSGLIMASLGFGLAASAFTVSRAAAIAAAQAAVGPASNPGAGSVTQGSASASGVPNVAGATPHVLMSTAGWQALVVAGALAMVAAGLISAARPARLAVMSSKYDSPASAAADSQPPAAGVQSSRPGHDSASVWEALSRGEDPTAGGRMTAGT